jgi:hypothetical protein
MNDKARKEVIVDCLKLLTQKLPTYTEDNNEKPRKTASN